MGVTTPCFEELTKWQYKDSVACLWVTLYTVINTVRKGIAEHLLVYDTELYIVRRRAAFFLHPSGSPRQKVTHMTQIKLPFLC